MPVVSVVIPAYNHENYVCEAVRSVLDQSVDDIEVIVIDDASSDSTWERLNAVDDPRVRKFRHERNLGAPMTLNEGVELARSPVIAILNSDDAYMPHRLEKALFLLEQRPECAAFFSHFEIMDEKGKTQGLPPELVSIPPPVASLSGQLSEAECRTLPLIARNFIHSTSNLICRVDVIRRLGGFRSYRYVHDHEFFLRLSAEYDWVIVSEALFRYRRHGYNTLSESAEKSVSETMVMLVEFILRGHIPSIHADGERAREALCYLAEHLRLYGGERWALLLALASRPCVPDKEGDALSTRVAQLLSWSDVSEAAVRQGLELSVQKDTLLWQQTQTEHWWREAMQGHEVAQRLARDMKWQKAQTDHWWSKFEEMVQLYEKSRRCGVPYQFQRIVSILKRALKINGSR